MVTTLPTDAVRRPAKSTSPRGPVEHERRVQILDAAFAYFRTYGYAKTTVADLAKAIGLSPAYIYKFFGSKQAIGEAVSHQALGSLISDLRVTAHSSKPAASRLRLIFRTVARRGTELHFNDRKLHDLTVTACTENWQPVLDYQHALLGILRDLITEGRKSGEFERKTPIAETSQAILQTLELFSLPLFLAHNLDDAEGKAESVANLVLRSLAP
jgi:AcrR family transcriptional regulator